MNGCFAQTLRHGQDLTLGITTIYLGLELSHSLIPSEISHFWMDMNQQLNHFGQNRAHGLFRDFIRIIYAFA